MPFGSILSQARGMNLETADNRKIYVTKISAIGLKFLGIPHIGVRERARLIFRAIKKLKISKTDKILDAGCGIGMYSLTLAKNGFNLTGVDIEKIKINQAKEIAKRAKINQINKNHLELEQGNVTNLNKKFKNKYNLVICSDVIEHIKNDKAAIRNLSQTLKSKGKLILTAPKITPYSENIKDYKRFGHVRLGYSEKEITSILEKNNLKILQLKTASSSISRWAFKLNEKLYSSPFLLAICFYPIYLLTFLSFLAPRKKDDGFFIMAEKM